MPRKDRLSVTLSYSENNGGIPKRGSFEENAYEKAMAWQKGWDGLREQGEEEKSLRSKLP